MTMPTRWTQPPAPGPGDAWAPRAQLEPAPGLVFGGFWIRFVAYYVDAILVEIIVILVVLAFIPSIAGVLLVSMIVMPVYFIGFWATTGQTIAMMPFRLRVVRNSDGGSRLSWISRASSISRAMRSFSATWTSMVLTDSVIVLNETARSPSWSRRLTGMR